MVGDRKFDIIGAKENSIRTVGVLWGYGSKDELEAELPDILIETPENLAKTILKMGNYLRCDIFFEDYELLFDEETKLGYMWIVYESGNA